MAVRMKENFDKYWSEYSVVLALGAILDPRLKFPLLECCFNRVDPTTCQSKLDVENHQVWAAFVKHYVQSQTKSISVIGKGELGDWKRNLISLELPNDIIYNIQAVPCCKNLNLQDPTCWKFQTYGHFCLKSAYNLALSNKPNSVQEIWLSQNKLIFENRVVDHARIGKRILMGASEFVHLGGNDKLVKNQNSTEILVQWKPPLQGWLKLNTDGSCIGNPSPIAAGCIIRDAFRNWIHGFSNFFGRGSSLKAKM
ncbi:zinc finger BED domain-containing protein RICESLEEPER 2-like [Senna tora]|uniref:Zinc finger BED domain-containing protein RICESLEEPER 2-like n=1 Tax=Senna tora TaxID=362788 RepID=A0A834X799_9FABA|nr:zinc finger BED domain-containing protein RICESLEEPER 2-like [Senna tora]